MLSVLIYLDKHFDYPNVNAVDSKREKRRRKGEKEKSLSGADKELIMRRRLRSSGPRLMGWFMARGDGWMCPERAGLLQVLQRRRENSASLIFKGKLGLPY